MSWDNAGFMVGSANESVDLAILAIDCTDAVIAEAVELGAQMIITHHPLFFSRLESVVDTNPTTRKIIKLIKSGICLYSAHTALDLAQDGTNDLLAEYLGLTELAPLITDGDEAGLGRVGLLEKPCSLSEFAAFASRKLNTDLRYCGDPSALIEKVALVSGGGSGEEFFLASVKAGAQVYLTGDVKYTHALIAFDLGLCLVDATHYATEVIFAKSLSQRLNTFAQDEGLDVRFRVSEKSGQVFTSVPAPAIEDQEL
jgi:dinuclear metal center YbgI/SA1388 family protein